MMRIVHFRRGPVGWFFEIVFYLFNLIMAIELIVLIARSGDILAAAETELARGVAGFGAAARLGLLLLTWVAGDLILGSLTIISRGRKALIEE
jgi:hypothetical protein